MATRSVGTILIIVLITIAFASAKLDPEGIEKLPMGPVTMMRNQLELKGGTAASYSSEVWAQAVNFWQKFAALDQE